MNERIKELRIAMKMSQEDFGKQMLGISKSGISDIESGRRKVTEQHIIMLKNHNINEEWLRNGTGEMFIEISRDEQIATFVGDLLKDETDSFKRRFISMLTSLDTSDWETLEKIVKLMQKEKD